MYNNLPGRFADEVCWAARSRRVHRAVCRVYDERLRDLGISVAQLDILVTLLYLDRPLRPTDLAREMLMERSTVTRNAARLQALGLLVVRPGENARERSLQVTAKGRRVVGRAEEGWATAQDHVRSVLGADGVRALQLVSERVGKET